MSISNKGRGRFFEISLFISAVVIGLSLAACDRDAFEKEHPTEAEIIEDVVDFGEHTLEGIAEQELHIPSKSLAPIFIHPVFPDKKPVVKDPGIYEYREISADSQ